MFKKKIFASSYDFLVVGLGNPDKKYEKTRHNIGFICADALAEKYETEIKKNKCRSLISEVKTDKFSFIIAKPQTYMNSSGEAVRDLMKFYKIAPENTIIIFDDISFDVGKIRIRRNGSHGGHNGMKSIVNLCGTDNFPRIKIGVGKKPHPEYDLADWVLSEFRGEDLDTAYESAKKGARAVECIMKSGIDTAMNRYSR